MSPDQWQRAKPLLTTLIGLSSEARAHALAEALPGEPEVCAELTAMLQAFDQRSARLDFSHSLGTRMHGTEIFVDASNDVLRSGVLVGPYKVERELGSGGMGHVWLANDGRLGRQVALKTVSPVLDEFSSREAVMREARLAAALEHQGIAALYDVVEHAGSYVLVMEYVEGRPLSELLADGPLPVGYALRITDQLAEAIAYAHDHGVVHCDVKPANVQVSLEGVPKLLDFGLAQLHTRSGLGVAHQDAGPLFGTAPYVAPERLLKGVSPPSCDVYSLGVLLFELLTGRLPFEAMSPMDVFFDVLMVTPLAPSSLIRGLPPEVDRLVERAMARDPRARFQSARELSRAIRAALVAVESGGTGPLPSVLAPARQGSSFGGGPRRAALLRHRMRMAALVSIGALGLLTFVGFITSRVYNTAVGRSGRFDDDSPLGWPVLGANAIVAPAALIVLLSIVISALSIVPKPTWLLQSARGLAQRVARVPLAGLANGLVILSAAMLTLLILWFRPLLEAVGSASSVPAATLHLLRPSNSALHDSYRIVSSLLLFAVSGAWVALLRRRAATGETLIVAPLFAGTAVLCAIVFVWALPYRLLWQAKLERVTHKGDQCYIVDEDRTDVLLFCPLKESPRTFVVPTADPNLARQNKTIEKVFTVLDEQQR